MEILKVLNLSTKHLRASTLETMYNFEVFNEPYCYWYIDTLFDEEVDIESLIDNYELEEDLAECVLYAIKNECDWIFFDNDTEIDINLPVYEGDYKKICENCSHIDIEATRNFETGFCYRYSCEVDLCDGCDCDHYNGY